ncbi:GNAT family N-acetyltransferase [Pseudonocardia ailaonensis]|uniref:GNAT family N-acetyltransferase n=1 Tax=Pseudonocardia ailaonensis TaxID=367279 RepID=A0ABN2MZY1_9PSEU
MRIRLATPDDAAAVAAVYAPYVRDTAISFESEPPPEAEMRERIAGTLPAHPWLVADLDGVRGYAYAGPHRSRAAYRWSVDVSVYTGPDVHRCGVGRALYTALLALLTEQGYAHAFAGVTLPNPPSVGFHEALGFEAVGVFRAVGYKFDRWRDVGWWQRPLVGPQASPAEPVPLARLDPAVVARCLG